MRYAPLYIHNFVLCAPRKIFEASQFNRRYRSYEEIRNIPDRLRWLRHSKGLKQMEVARQTGISKAVYNDMENGSVQHMSAEWADRLAALYGVSAEDFLDGYDRFLLDGQARCIRAYRDNLGMSKKAFSRHTGIPPSSLRSWESGKKTISRQSWERYFEGRA